MHLIEITPAPCLVCGRGNTPDNDGHRIKFLDLERDVNWNDPAVLCEDCGVKVGTFFDMLTPDDKQDLERQVAKKEQEVHEAKADAEAAHRRTQQTLRRVQARETITKAKKPKVNA